MVQISQGTGQSQSAGMAADPFVAVATGRLLLPGPAFNTALPGFPSEPRE
jgi:hypothetical protein